MSFEAYGGRAEAPDEDAESPNNQYLLPPALGSTGKGFRVVPPCEGQEACLPEDMNLAELANSCLMWSRDQKGRRHFGLRGFLFHLGENRQGCGKGAKHPAIKTQAESQLYHGVALGKSVCFPETRFLHLQNGNLTGLL